jgi:hypothetical protein
MIGFNLAGLKYLKREWDVNHSSEFLEAIGEIPAGDGGEDEEKGGDGERKSFRGKNHNSSKRKRAVVVSK